MGLLRDGRVQDRPWGNSYERSTFSSRGVFALRDLFGDRHSLDFYWCGGLLGYDPRECTVKTTRQGDLMVLDRNDVRTATIPASVVRKLGNADMGVGLVRGSGYVLGEDGYHIGRMSLTTQEFNEILVSAERGIEPPAYDERVFMKVLDQTWIGKYVSVAFFEHDFGRNQDHKDIDGVVIGEGCTGSRRLLARQVVRPLARAKWVQSE